MTMTPFNIFASSSGTNLRQIESGVVVSEVPGLGKVETYGGGLRWRQVSVPKDNSIITEKRDRFERRNALVNGIAEVGSFEYALAVAPSIGGKRLAQCSFCNAHHNWVVFYRSTEGKYLGWSGTNCFGEICRNLQLPAAEAMIEQIKKERSRNEKFRRTMEKVNDFKRDFPGLYENREILGSRHNPYYNLWWATRNRLNNMDGVDEKWLQSCLDGAYDRTYSTWEGGGRVVKQNQEARRIPAFLKWVSGKIGDGTPIGEVMKQLQEQKAKEHAEAMDRAKAAMAQPTPQPAQPVVVHTLAKQTPPAPKPNKPDADQIQAMGRKLLASGKFGWSNVVRQAAEGKEMSEGAINFLIQNCGYITLNQNLTEKAPA
jgi:hypothetical protein